MEITKVDVVTEAFERCGIDAEAITGTHLESASRSLRFMYNWLSGKYQINSSIVPITITLVLNDGNYPIQAGVIDLITIMYRDDSGVDTPLEKSGIREYQDIADKTADGVPVKAFLDRSITSDGTKTLRLYPVPDATAIGTGSYLIIQAMTFARESSGLGADIPVDEAWYEAIAAELASRLSVKYSPDRTQMLTQLAAQALRDAKGANSDGTQITFGI